MTGGKPSVLIVDDKRNMISLLRRVMEDVFTVLSASNGREALSLLGRQAVDVIVSDIVMPELDGMELLMQARRRSPRTQIILMTGYGTIEQAVQAGKAGAFDYIAKPFDPDEMVDVVHRALGVRDRVEQDPAWPGLVGVSTAMQRVRELLETVRNTDATVLLTGESGTGKTLVARLLHAAGKRAAARFVAVNCGAIPRDLIEAELMGYQSGAFTGATTEKKGLAEEASGGTLFLDEIGELPVELQVKMNMLIQDREVRRLGELGTRKVDVRIIAGTNRDLEAMVQDHTFRKDLYYRLNVFPIEVPPLRERREDIPLLAAHHLALAAAREARSIDGITPAAEAILTNHDWPGNVRELENVIDRAVLVTTGDRLTPEDLPRALGSGRAALLTLPEDLASLTYRQLMEVASDNATRAYLKELLDRYSGNVTRAAAHAGLERQSLHRLLRRHGVHSREFKD